jgi:hypothetical protein
LNTITSVISDTAKIRAAVDGIGHSGTTNKAIRIPHLPPHNFAAINLQLHVCLVSHKQFCLSTRRIIMKKTALLVCLLVLFFATAEAQEPDAGKHAANSTDAHQLLPYAVDQALEGFAKTANGGIMQIIAKSANDAQQIKLMQQYLRQTAEEYGKGDFSSTERFHGTDMPGLAQMKAAKAGEIKYQYKVLNNGGQIIFSSEDPQLLNALHAWIDAQVKEHGSAGLSGHD